MIKTATHHQKSSLLAVCVAIAGLYSPTGFTVPVGTDVGAYFGAVVGVPVSAIAVFFAGMVLVIAIAWAAWVTRAQAINFIEGRIGFPLFLGSIVTVVIILLFIWMYAAA